MMIDKRKVVCCDYFVFSSGALPGGAEEEIMRNEPKLGSGQAPRREIMQSEPNLGPRPLSRNFSGSHSSILIGGR